VAERVAECLPGGTTERVDQQLHVRVMRNQVTLSLDASGAPLHHRAWRSTGGKAPLRATMAAALLSASGWDARRPLVDPFCGSGTIAVEAAMIARRIAPGAERTFAWQRWSSFDAAAWQRQLDAAAANVLARCPPVVATDRDAGAVRTTRAHAQRAGVDQQVEVRQASISEMLLPPRPGWVVTNPPYGRRLGDDVRNVYAAFGSALRAGSGWNVAVIVPRDAPLAQMRVPFEVVGSTTHGGLRVDFRRSAPEPAADTVMV
jgi:putative N6-adenine-specific DNA methylase